MSLEVLSSPPSPPPYLGLIPQAPEGHGVRQREGQEAEVEGGGVELEVHPHVGSGRGVRGALAKQEKALTTPAGVRDQGSGIRNQGPGIRDQGSGIRDRGSGIRDQGSGYIPNQMLARMDDNTNG